MTKQEEAQYLAALLEERAGYARIQDYARVAEVDKELKKLGHEAEKPVDRAVRRGPGRPRKDASSSE